LGVAGLVLAITGAVMDKSIIAAAAGVFALTAGAFATWAESHSIREERRLNELQQALDDSQLQLEVVQSELEHTRQTVHETRASVAELLERAPEPTRDDSPLLTDPETELFSEAYFKVALDSRIASARRHLRPVAIALLDVAEGIDTDGAPAANPMAVTGSVRQTLRDADTACRLGDGSFALILEDTPENGAVWTVERIRRNLTSRHGLHTMWAGVACYPAHAFSTDELLTQAADALASAREWKQDRIEVATAE
jgi:two-component system cell cycle response regulator